MLILHEIKGWQCRHLDCVLAFILALTDTDIYLKILLGFHIEDSDSNNISISYYLKLLKNYYGTHDTAANWYAVLLVSLEERSFNKSTIDPCLFTREDYIIITYVDNYLIFYKKRKS